MYKILEKILSRSFKSATKIQLSKDSKFIFFSDVHKGNNGHGDDFAHNRNIYYHALRTYFEGGYSYFELGDGIELWENNKFEDIFEAHEDIFLLMKDFYLEERLHLLWGNHDMVLRNPNKVKKLFGKYFDKNTGDIKLLMEKLTFDESIVLEVDGKEKNILLIHGHQADLFNYVFWKFNRFLVRILWSPLQVIGIKNPASPAKNYRDLIRVERTLERWISENNNQMVIAGHTHRPRFPEPNELHYFNDGSCVHPRFITGIEIVDMKISLIKWQTTTQKDGTLQIVKTLLEGPTAISQYLT
ncbi:MAG: metallophosphoesterase family protein [Bacteroidetes bacterium]|nr:metallophosphoesterase family protein [Bacteroidota bacterium]